MADNVSENDQITDVDPGPTVDTEGIYNSIKLMLGMEPDYKAFDTDIIIHINTALAKLTQVGVGPETGYELDLVDPTTSKWEDFLGNDASKILNMVKTYVYTQVKLMFDPPQNSFTQDLIKKEAEELIWRINVQADDWSHMED